MSVTRRSLLLSALGGTIAAASHPMTGSTAESPSGRNFYVDPDGRDGADGRSPWTAWATLARAGSADLRPGDIVNLKRGAVFAEELRIPSSGTERNPIVITSYGSGARPVILGAEVATGWRSADTAWMKTMRSMPGVVIEDGRPMNWVRWEGTFQRTNQRLRSGDFSYEPSSRTVYMKPTSGRPTDHVYEVAQQPHGISAFGKNYITVRGITLRGFARHGIVAANVTGWLVENNLISCGGGFWEPENEFLGNGLEFSADCHDCIARDNLITDIFDSGMTIQTYPRGQGKPSNICFENNEISRCGLSGIEIALYRNGDTLSKCLASRNVIKDTGRGWSGIGDGTTGGHAIYVYSISDKPATKMSGVVIDRNKIIANAGDGIYILNNCGTVRASSNLVASNDGRGIYFKLYENVAGGLDATGNTICRNKQGGIHFESYYGTCRIASNSLYRNGSERDGGNDGRGTHNIYVHEYVRSGLSLEGNIVHAVESAALWMSDDQSIGSRAEYNCYFRSKGPVAVAAGRAYGPSNFRAALGDGGTSMAADPRYRDAEAADYALRPDSPCVGAGPKGADLGAQLLWG